jgi:hypothetical protein
MPKTPTSPQTEPIVSSNQAFIQMQNKSGHVNLRADQIIAVSESLKIAGNPPSRRVIFAGGGQIYILDSPNNRKILDAIGVKSMEPQPDADIAPPKKKSNKSGWFARKNSAE